MNSEQIDDWSGAQEVAPVEPEPKRCASCGLIFIPKWPSAKRCDWCRKNKMPYLDDTISDKPF